MKKIKQFEIWIADLNPRFGTEPGKRRPVCIVQTNLLNGEHPSTLVCPVTTNVVDDAEILRVQIKKGQAGMNKNCDIMIDQLRAIDNARLIKKAGEIPESLRERVKENLSIVLDIF